MSAIPGLQYVYPTQARLLGSPGNMALQRCWKEQLNQLLFGDHLGRLHMQMASPSYATHFLSPSFCIFCVPPLLFPHHHWKLGATLYMMAIVSRVININFKQGDASWSQATLLVNSGGLGFRSTFNLAPSVFLASADGVSDLTRQLLPTHLSAASHGDRDLALSTWKDALDTPLLTATHQQQSWDQPAVRHLFDSLWPTALISRLERTYWALALVSQEHGLTHLLSRRWAFACLMMSSTLPLG